jgi:RNA exonuclease 1
LKILHPKTILIGHSLNADLAALKVTHPFIIDTSLLYPHPRGAPLKQSLKFLAQRYLNREIQRGHGTTGPGAGHDSIEDARTCLDLVKQKCEKGPQWGESESANENIFKRLSRTGITYKNQAGTAVVAGQIGGKTGAAVDWGDPRKGVGAAASVVIGCSSDEDVTNGVIRAVNGDSDGLLVRGGGVDFVWGRMRELEALKGWWNNNKSLSSESTLKPPDLDSILEAETKEAAVLDVDLGLADREIASRSIDQAAAAVASRIFTIYESLPPCTAFIVYSGSGDPREMSRLQAMQQTFKREYKIKKWDQLSVKWTDVEEQLLKKAAKQARDGIGFVCVK